MADIKIHQSRYGGLPENFHVVKSDDTLQVTLTYPPRSNHENKNNQVRYVEFDQESVRASDGIRIYYDYDRDGYVIEQPKTRLLPTKRKGSYDSRTKWIEVGFFQSWRFEFDNMDKQFEAADRLADIQKGK